MYKYKMLFTCNAFFIISNTLNKICFFWQDKQRSRFFSIFYLSINAGSLLSTIITPILRGIFMNL